MSIESLTFLFATDGSAIQALPFVVPPVILIAGLLFISARDRRRQRSQSE